MPTFFHRAALRTALATAAVLALTAPAGAQFVPEYPPVQDAEAARHREALMESGYLERVSGRLNQWIRMPRRVPLRVMECTSSDIRWNAEEHALEICYRMGIRLSGIAGDQDSLRQAIGWAETYMTVHGIAHAVMDELDLPAGADPEATVTELQALLIMSRAGPEGAFNQLNGMTMLQRADPGWGSWAHATTHRLGPEQFGTVACLVYGMNPERFVRLRSGGLVPAGAQQRCRTAGTRVLDVWGRRLSRYLR